MIATVRNAAAGENEALSPDELKSMHAWWRAANYLSAGQIYLLDNPLLQEPLKLAHINPACSVIGALRRA